MKQDKTLLLLIVALFVALWVLPTFQALLMVGVLYLLTVSPLITKLI